MDGAELRYPVWGTGLMVHQSRTVFKGSLQPQRAQALAEPLEMFYRLIFSC